MSYTFEEFTTRWVEQAEKIDSSQFNLLLQGELRRWDKLTESATKEDLIHALVAQSIAEQSVSEGGNSIKSREDVGVIKTSYSTSSDGTNASNIEKYIKRILKSL